MQCATALILCPAHTFLIITDVWGFCFLIELIALDLLLELLAFRRCPLYIELPRSKVGSQRAGDTCARQFIVCEPYVQVGLSNNEESGL